MQAKEAECYLDYSNVIIIYRDFAYQLVHPSEECTHHNTHATNKACKSWKAKDEMLTGLKNHSTTYFHLAEDIRRRLFREYMHCAGGKLRQSVGTSIVEVTHPPARHRSAEKS